MAGPQRGRTPPSRVRRRDQSGALMHKVGYLVVAVILASAGLAQAGVIPSVGSGSDSAAHGMLAPPGPSLRLATVPAPSPVLDAGSGQTPISKARLQDHLAKALAQHGLGPRLGFAVASLGAPDLLWSSGPGVVTPASTMKLLTTSAALSVLGPAARFTTSVVEGADAGSIVLVGGGDPLLAATRPSPSAAGYPAPATLQDLAQRTADRLRSEGRSVVRLSYDVSLFSGPAVNPRWPATYLPENVVSPISALWVNEGREKPGLAQRSADPARAAAAVFGQLLERAGIKVRGGISEGPAPVPQTLVSSVVSAPLEEVVQHILEASDNEGTEVLLRQVAIAAGRPGSFDAGVTAVRSALTSLGLDLSGATFYDGSGLSRQDRLPVSLLIRVLQTAADPAHPDLHGVVTSLSVAGFTGSLGDRFAEDAPDGLGYVRAKTGTLTGVHALAGLAFTRDGQVLVFAAVADRVSPLKGLDAEDDLDRIAAALSTCGC